MSVGSICSRITHLAETEESVRVAAKRMKEENLGTLVVLDAKRRPTGILTDRDLAVRVVAAGLDAHTTTVGQVMTTHPRWVHEDTPIEQAVVTMRRLGVRRLPVVDGAERLVGILSIDDVLELVTEELANLGRIVGFSHPGSSVPAARGRTPRRVPATAGLERAASDPEC